MTGISVQIAALSNGYSAAKGILEIIERSRPSLPQGEQGHIMLDNVQGSIKFDEVDFSYPARPDVRVYNRLTLEVPAGKTTAIIGASGYGKSMISIFQHKYSLTRNQVNMGRQLMKNNLHRYNCCLD